MKKIIIGSVIQLVPFENQPDKARIFLVQDTDYDAYANNVISLRTALDFQRKGLIKQIFKSTN